MNTSIKIKIHKNHEIELLQENPKINCYELVCENGDYLTIYELQKLNQEGYIYHSSQLDIEYEDGNSLKTKVMDIHYFAKVNTIIFADCFPE